MTASIGGPVHAGAQHQVPTCVDRREAGRCLVIAGPVDHRAASTRYPHTLVLDAAIQIAAGASRGSNPPGAPVFLKEGAEGHKKTVPGRAFEECHVRESSRTPGHATARRWRRVSDFLSNFKRRSELPTSFFTLRARDDDRPLP